MNTSPHHQFLHSVSAHQSTRSAHVNTISLSGASKIIRFLRSTDYACSRPLDQLPNSHLRLHLIESYSIYLILACWQTFAEMRDISVVLISPENSPWWLAAWIYIEKLGLYYASLCGPILLRLNRGNRTVLAILFLLFLLTHRLFTAHGIHLSGYHGLFACVAI